MPDQRKGDDALHAALLVADAYIKPSEYGSARHLDALRQAKSEVAGLIEDCRRMGRPRAEDAHRVVDCRAFGFKA
ncbi:MAG: hypothetical protein WA051_02935 [Minisyncoccia bacterium]